MTRAIITCWASTFHVACDRQELPLQPAPLLYAEKRGLRVESSRRR